MKSIFNLALLSGVLAVSVSQALAQAPAPSRIRGDIVSVDATTLTIHRRSGDTVKVAIKPDQAVAALKRIDLSEVKKGAFIGTASKKAADGSQVAIEVVVFPESARGTGEGHYDWDLLPGSMMTNANVDTVNEGVSGRTLKLSYKGGTTDVTLPDNVPVVTPVPAARADLVAGKKVFLVADGDPEHLSAVRIIVEKDGVAPPM